MHVVESVFGRVMAGCASALVTTLVLGSMPGTAIADEPPAPVRHLGTPLDNARFEINGQVVLRGTFASNVLIDSVSLGEITYSREEGRLYEIAAINVYALDPSGNARLLTDEELASGTGPCRIVAARDMDLWPSSAIDTIGGYAVSSLLATDGSAAIRIDVLFPNPIIDDAPDLADRKPEAIILGPPPSGPILVGAIIAGDLYDPVIATPMVEVPPEALAAGRSNLSVLYGRDRAVALPVAIVGYDLNDLSTNDLPLIGLRIEIPRDVLMSCKVFGAGKSDTQMLASVDSAPLIGALESGFSWGNSGGGGLQGPLQLPPPIYSPLAGAPAIPGGGGGGIRPRDVPPVVPAPAAALVLAPALLRPSGRSRRA